MPRIVQPSVTDPSEAWLKGAGTDLTWPLFTASQDEKLNDW